MTPRRSNALDAAEDSRSDAVDRLEAARDAALAAAEGNARMAAATFQEYAACWPAPGAGVLRGGRSEDGDVYALEGIGWALLSISYELAAAREAQELVARGVREMLERPGGAS